MGLWHGGGMTHEELERLRLAYLDARRAWRVGLRVHLEEENAWAGRGDPEVVHRRLHGSVSGTRHDEER